MSRYQGTRSGSCYPRRRRGLEQYNCSQCLQEQHLAYRGNICVSRVSSRVFGEHSGVDDIFREKAVYDVSDFNLPEWIISRWCEIDILSVTRQVEVIKGIVLSVPHDCLHSFQSFLGLALVPL